SADLPARDDSRTLSRALVVFPIAEATIRSLSLEYNPTIFEALRIASAVRREAPPNLKTLIFISFKRLRGIFEFHYGKANEYARETNRGVKNSTTHRHGSRPFH